MKSEPVVKFNSLEEVKDYLGRDKISCLICGKLYVHLADHLIRVHDVTLDHYRETYNIPYYCSLITSRYGITQKGKSGELVVCEGHDSTNLFKMTLKRCWAHSPENKKKIGTANKSHWERLPPEQRTLVSERMKKYKTQWWLDHPEEKRRISEYIRPVKKSRKPQG